MRGGVFKRLRWIIGLPALLVMVAIVAGCDRRSEWDEVKVTSEHVERLARDVKLDADQKRAAMDLLTAYQLQHAQALEKMSSYREAYERAIKAGETPEQKAHFAETTARYERHCRALRDGLIVDLRSILTGPQEARWPRFERWYRRGELLPKGTLHGESVDIERLIERFRPLGTREEAVDQLIDEYSVEIDAALTARQTLIERRKPTGDAEMPPEAVAAAIERMIDDEHQARLRVRRVNFAFAERAAGLIEGDGAEQFRRAFDAAAYPEVFSRESADAAFGEVLRLEDLTDEQRGAIEQVRAEYEAALPDANRRWAEGIRRGEDRLTARVLLARAREPGGPTDDDRGAREALDLRARSRVAAVLTPAQRQRLSWASSTSGLPRVEF
ncbi:MAG: hypothetical protein JNK58_03175 [Phycisphaerae bacterium]|nr:hypothetical protein [Phycisphaerae bacterium]